MKKVYKIYEVSIASVDHKQYQQGHNPPKIIFPTVLREVFQGNILYDEDTFDTLEAAEAYLQDNLITRYGNTYTILTQYTYD
jgi:hypothetical protein